MKDEQGIVARPRSVPTSTIIISRRESKVFDSRLWNNQSFCMGKRRNLCNRRRKETWRRIERNSDQKLSYFDASRRKEQWTPGVFDLRINWHTGCQFILRSNTPGVNATFRSYKSFLTRLCERCCARDDWTQFGSVIFFPHGPKFWVYLWRAVYLQRVEAPFHSLKIHCSSKMYSKFRPDNNFHEADYKRNRACWGSRGIFWKVKPGSMLTSLIFRFTTGSVPVGRTDRRYVFPTVTALSTSGI